MAYQGVEYNEPCLERKNTRKEASSIDRREKEKHQKRTLQEAWKLRRNEKEQEKKELERSR